AAAPAVLVKEYTAGTAAPGTVAFTVYGPPAVALAVTGAVATPAALVTAVTVVMPAPLAGPVNVTVTPATGLLPASFTVATSGLPNAVLTCTLCPPPLVAVIVPGGPVVLVREYAAGAATPGTAAFTVYGPPVVALAVTAAVATPEALVTT